MFAARFFSALCWNVCFRLFHILLSPISAVSEIENYKMLGLSSYQYDSNLIALYRLNEKLTISKKPMCWDGVRRLEIFDDTGLNFVSLVESFLGAVWELFF